MFGRAAIVALIMLMGVAGLATAELCVLPSDDRDREAAAEFVQCLRQKAEQGDVKEQHRLSIEYMLGGHGVTQDYAEAVKWLRRAADQGSSEAQFNLGGMYAHGLGVPKDVVRAHMWFNLSGAQGFHDGREQRDILAQDMTPAQIAEAQRLARECSCRRGVVRRFAYATLTFTISWAADTGMHPPWQMYSSVRSHAKSVLSFAQR